VISQAKHFLNCLIAAFLLLHFAVLFEKQPWRSLLRVSTNRQRKSRKWALSSPQRVRGGGPAPQVVNNP